MQHHTSTIEDILRIVFPLGTRPGAPNDPIKHSEPPRLATDIFAFGGYLVQVSGLMGYFCPSGEGPACRITISQNESDACKAASDIWRNHGNFPQLVTDLWQIIYQARSKTISPPAKTISAEAETAALWQQSIFKLIIIADEACEGIGHFYDDVNSDDDSWAFWDTLVYRSRLSESRSRNDVKEDSYILASGGVSTLGYVANRAVVCVQPKGRVAQLGCSIRNLTRNLALTGPMGGVRCSWQQLAGKANQNSLRDAMNILLIPWPVKIRAKAFKPTARLGQSWGDFTVEQQWIDPEVRKRNLTTGVSELPAFSALRAEIIAIAKAALKDVDQIDGIVFPELALTAAVFGELMKDLSDSTDLPPIKFMISGTKGNCQSDTGNHVMMAVNEALLVEPLEGTAPENAIRLFSQRKHHRWRLEKNQISTYGLGSALSPSKIWWEDHDIGSRELNFFQIRKDTIIASLICEDLARNDPCHDIMRSVAPNLVFALLMDGPQLASRWPARYASTLAEDPGSTVITLTSFGLVERSNDQFPVGKSRSIGLIRDGRGTTKEITYPEGASAVVLTLGSERVEDFTIDGRSTTNASEWYYVSQTPVKKRKNLPSNPSP